MCVDIAYITGVGQDILQESLCVRVTAQESAQGKLLESFLFSQRLEIELMALEAVILLA